MAFQYAEKISSWSCSCDNVNIPSEATVLESSIHQHQTIYEAMCQAYTEVSKSFFVLSMFMGDIILLNPGSQYQ